MASYTRTSWPRSGGVAVFSSERYVEPYRDAKKSPLSHGLNLLGQYRPSVPVAASLPFVYFRFATLTTFEHLYFSPRATKAAHDGSTERVGASRRDFGRL